MASCKLASIALKNVQNLDTGNRGERKGWGAYGAVYKVMVDGMPCIAKRLHDILVNPEVPQRQKDFIQQKFHDECVLLSKLRHPNVVHFVGVHYGSNEDGMSLIMECLDSDLARYLESQPNIPIEVKLSILLDVSYGLLYLHTHPLKIIHRDLTAANILLTRDKRAKLADLGVSKLLDPQTQAAMIQTKAPGTLHYMPPEALKENPRYDEKLDIFSFGHLALYVINQVFPEVFEVTITSAMLREETLQILKRQKAINEMGRDHCLHNVVTKCLQDNPQKRPTTLKLNEMLNHLCMEHPREDQDKDQVAKLERGIAELQTVLSEVEHDRQDVLQELSKVKQQRDTLEQKYLSSLAKFDCIFGQVAQLKLEASQWKATFSSQNSELFELRRENCDLKAEIEAMKTESQTEVKAVTRQLSEQMNRISELNDDSVKQINELKAQVRKLEEEKETLQNELAELKGHTKELQAKTEEKPKKDAEKVKLSNEGATFPDPTDEKIAEEEEELGDENDTLQNELSAPLPTVGLIDLKEFKLYEPYEGGSRPDQTLESITYAQTETVATQDSDESSHRLTMQRIPYDDPNLTCPKCKKQFWMGEIQKYRAHVNKQCVDHKEVIADM